MPLFAYGNFITVALNFVILAFIIFLMVKQINRLRRAAAAAAPPRPPEDIVAAARDPRLAEALTRGGRRRDGVAPCSRA